MEKKLKNVNTTTVNAYKLSSCTGNHLVSGNQVLSNTNNAGTTITTSSSPFMWKHNQTTKESCKRSSLVTQHNNQSNNANRHQRNITTVNVNVSPNKNLPNHETTQRRTSNKVRNNSNYSNNHNTSSINVLTNSQPLKASKAAACIASPMDQLTAIHAKVTSGRNKNEEAIHDLRTRIPEIENIFDIHNRIGNGTFSTVLLGTLKKERDLPENQRRKFAIKHHIPTSHPDRIMKELQCMAKIGGSDNVVGINCCIRYNESVAFIMPYLAHERFHDFYSQMDLAETQFYLKNLLIALRHVHRFNVIHRDVKPSNFLYNRRKRQFLLVDFGLAQQVPSSYSILANSIGSKCANLSLPPPKNMMLEGKRTRDQEECEIEKTHNDSLEAISGSAKRFRCNGPQGDQQILAGCSFNQSSSKLQTKTGNTSNNNNHNRDRSVTSGSTHVGKTNVGGSRLNQVRHPGGSDVSSATKRGTPANDSTALTRTVNSANGVVEYKYNTNRSLTNSTNKDAKCHCYGNPQVCNICLVKKEIHASRAGTPGYRPPEVLLKYSDQTTAVDMWAAGVIFLSILSSVYPFFKAPNDYVALAEMVTIFGDKAIRKTAFILDRLVTLSQKTRPLDLRKLCVRFRNRAKFSSPELLKKYTNPDGTCEVCKNCDQFYFNCLCVETHYTTESIDDDDTFPSSAYDLLYKLLEVNPHKRITAEEALQHSFFQENINNTHISRRNLTTSKLDSIKSATLTTMVTSKTDEQHKLPLPITAAAGDSTKKPHK